MDYKKMIKTFPFVFTLFMIPIAMRLIMVQIPYEVQLHWKGTSVDPDIFSYFRSILLIVNAVIIAVLLFFSFTSDTFVKIKKLKPFLIAFGVLFITAILSTVIGGNSVISLGGAPSRYEGLYTFIAYFFIFLYAVTLEYDKTTHHVIIITLAFFTIACSIVGLTQFLGKDIFLSKLGVLYYIPESLKQYRESMGTTAFTFKTMYLFTTHYNYSSMLTSILSMFWATYFVCSQERPYKIIAGVMAVLSVLMLLGANGRSGIVAILFAIIVLAIIFFKKLIQNKKIVIGIVVVIIAFVGVALQLGLMSRFTALVDDIKKIDVSNEQGQDYIKSQIPLKNIETTETTYTIVYDTFALKFDKEKSIFYDENNNELKFTTPQQGKIVFTDSKYAPVSISVSAKKSNTDENKTNMYHTVNISGHSYNFELSENVKLVNHLGIEMHPENAKRIGFKGMEKIGSGRGFITASTIPLILKSPIIGYGSDAFLQVFNQDDIYTKLYVYGNPSELVDKPHNLYLLYAVNFGLFGLFAFLFMIIYLFVKTSRKYKNEDTSKDALYIACVAGVITYMGAGFFNDSVVAVSPIFWAMLGIAISKIGEDNQALL